MSEALQLGVIVLVATLMGLLARLYMLRVDYRQYPSYPQGYAIHLTLGFIAAFLAAVLIPALLDKEYTAVTFLAFAATQFREVRAIERTSLANMENTELVPRGSAYIEGIARVFEARNYLAMLTSLFAAAGAQLVLIFLKGQIIPAVGAAVITGLVVLLALRGSTTGQVIGDIAEIHFAPVEFEGPLLKVGGVVLMNVGLEEARNTLQREGMGAVIKPKDENAKATLANLGQRQAILHDVATLLGVRLDIGEPDFTPLARRHLKSGAVSLVLLASEYDPDALVKAISRVPVLEAAKKRPLDEESGRMAR